MKKVFLSLALLALVTVGCVSATTMKKKKEKEETCSDCHCQVEAPLTDLGWLKDKVIEFDYPAHVPSMKVYTCKYQNNKDGFFFEEVGVRDGQQYLYDCKGNLLCIIGGIVGRVDTVYNVDYTSLQLIYPNL